MKVLLDECIDWRFARELPGHEVSTVGQRRWKGMRNGALLRIAVKDGFAAFVTVDRNLSFQQPLGRIDLEVFVLCARSIRLCDLVPPVPQLRVALATAEAGKLIFISA